MKSELSLVRTTMKSAQHLVGLFSWLELGGLLPVGVSKPSGLANFQLVRFASITPPLQRAGDLCSVIIGVWIRQSIR